MRLPIALATLFLFQVVQATHADQKGPVLDNEFVRVSRDAAPCASGSASCGDRVLVALGDISFRGAKMARGDVKAVKSGEKYAPPATGEYLEVSIKPSHPKVAAPASGTPAAPENKVLYDGKDFTVFAEKMKPGELSSVHSHNLRIAIFLNRTLVEQWESPASPATGKGNTRELVPDTIMWRPAVVHVSKDVGQAPISNLLIEFKPQP